MDATKEGRIFDVLVSAAGAGADVEKLPGLYRELMAASVESLTIRPNKLVEVGAVAGGKVGEFEKAPPSPSYVQCAECGATLRTLKRHLILKHGLTVQAYRFKHGARLPVVCKEYSDVKRQEAELTGLGLRR